MTMKFCQYRGGCNLEGKRLFKAPPLELWYCEAHFLDIVNKAAEVEAQVHSLPAVMKAVVEESRKAGRKLTAPEVTIEVARRIYGDIDPRILAEREGELLPIIMKCLEAEK
jgi:hypothetical protein